MAAKAKSVPQGFEKYFRIGDSTEFVEANLTTKDSVELLEEVIETVLNVLNLKFCGWAFAKDEYIEQLSKCGLSALVIVREGRSARKLVDLDLENNQLNYVSPETIQTLLAA